jgi:hypothetical protein
MKLVSRCYVDSPNTSEGDVDDLHVRLAVAVIEVLVASFGYLYVVEG